MFRSMGIRKARWFWPVLVALPLADCSTKQLVVSEFAADPGPHSLLGQVVRVTLSYNPGAALNMDLGEWSRLVFSLVAVGAVLLLLQLYRKTEPGARLRALALALVAGGAMGNLLDRIRSPRGVVDFIDIGIGDTRFWTFNLADLGVSIGTLLLALVLWNEDRLRTRTAR